jgi:hypothetical protein
MKYFISSISISLIILIFLSINSCKEDKGLVNPESQTTLLSGSITYPFDSNKLNGSSILIGDQEITADNEGKFEFSCNTEVSALVILKDDEENPLLLSLIPDPGSNTECIINIESTALALVFLNPLICNPDPVNADVIVQNITSLPGFTALEAVIESKLSSENNPLLSDDEEVGIALKNVVAQYINSLNFDSSSALSKTKNLHEDAIVISPLSIVSGHQVQHKGEDNFSISNWYGRWAKCITPEDTMFLSPNNDFLWTSRPWAPSFDNFKLEIIPNDPAKEINVYGLGLNNEPEMRWDNLTEIEKNDIEFTGSMTVLIEFLPRFLSLTTNFPFSFGSKNEAVEFAGNIVRWQVQYAKTFEKSKLLLKEGKYFQFYENYLKEIISLLVTDDTFRDFFMKTAGIQLSKSAFEKLAMTLLFPLNVLYIADDLTGLAKTVLGLQKSSFKSTFKVYSEEFNFGNVNGTVSDKESGKGIQGAVVKLLGDENNPMNPNYTAVTDETGGFWFENIMEGEKVIEVSKEEYGGKSVSIQVEQDKTTEISIILSKEKGTIKGRIVNDIFIKNNINPINFNKDCHLDINEIGGNNFSSSFWVWGSNLGEYEIALTPGTYELKAWHEDYKEAIINVTVAGDEITEVDDLVMIPDSYMKGTIHYDMNFDGSSEYSYEFEAETSGGMFNNEPGSCPDNTDRSYFTIGGINNYETIFIVIDTNQIKESGAFGMGGLWTCGCLGYEAKSTAIITTNRFQCTHEEYGYQQDMAFAISGDPDDIPCDCGLSNPGNIYLSEYGIEIGDVIEGSIVCKLAGWKNCHCSCCDDEGNYTVDCSIVELDIEFKVIVGSLNENGKNNFSIENSLNN